MKERIWHGFTRKVKEKEAVCVTKLFGSLRLVGAKMDASTVIVYSLTKLRAWPEA